MVKYIVLLNRRSDIDKKTFLERWHKGHLPLLENLPGLKRCVLSSSISTPDYESLFDGMGELWFESVDAALDAFNTPAGEAARRDTPEFADPDSVVRFFVEELYEYNEEMSEANGA